MRQQPSQRLRACKHAFAFAVAVYTVSVSGRALSNKQQLREPATPNVLLDQLSQPGQRNPALTDIQSWDTAGTADQAKGPALLTATTSGLSPGDGAAAATQADGPPAGSLLLNSSGTLAAVSRAAHAAPEPDPSPTHAPTQSPGLLAVIADLPGDDSPAGAVAGPAASLAAGSQPAAGTAGMSTGTTGHAAGISAGSTASSRTARDFGSTTGRTGGSPASALGNAVTNSTSDTTGSRAEQGAAAAGQWPVPDRPSRGETGVTLGNIAAAEIGDGDTAGPAASADTTDVASAAATAGLAAAGNAVLGGTASVVGGRKAGSHTAVVTVSSQGARSSSVGTASNGTQAFSSSSSSSSSSGCSKNSSRCGGVLDSTQADAADASSRDSRSSSSSSSSASVSTAVSSDDDSNSSRSTTAGASPSVKPQHGHPHSDGATVVTEEGSFHVPERCIIAGSALFSSCALEIYAAQSHFFNLTGPYMGPANYTQLLSEQGVSQAQVLQYLKEALTSPRDNCCAALCCFNQLLLCDCEPPVLQLAVSFTGLDEGFYALLSRQLSRSCGIKSFYGDSCPAALAYPGSSAAACTGATWPPVHRQQSGPVSGGPGADVSSGPGSGPDTEVGHMHAGTQSVGGSPTIVCMASTEEDEGMPEG